MQIRPHAQPKMFKKRGFSRTHSMRFAKPLARHDATRTNKRYWLSMHPTNEIPCKKTHCTYHSGMMKSFLGRFVMSATGFRDDLRPTWLGSGHGSQRRRLFGDDAKRATTENVVHLVEWCPVESKVHAHPDCSRQGCSRQHASCGRLRRSAALFERKRPQ
jgi:hypothetical protein